MCPVTETQCIQGVPSLLQAHSRIHWIRCDLDAATRPCFKQLRVRPQKGVRTAAPAARRSQSVAAAALARSRADDGWGDQIFGEQVWLC